MYDFDRITERKGSGCVKVDLAEKLGLPKDTIPLWVADMDFETAPEVKEAVLRAAAHGIYGYPMQQDSYFAAVQGWFLRRFGWEVQKSWLKQTPGVVFALAAAVRAFSKDGDGVLIQRPVYYPFSKVIEENGRVVVNNPLKYEEGRYTIDFEDFEEKIVKNRVKLFLFCNPHNPVGRVWTREELTRLGQICNRHQVFVVSDEIHCDFIRKGFCHQNYAALGPEYAENVMVCTAPSKTFNLAGLQISNIFIPNEEKRKLFSEELNRVSYREAGIFGSVACEAAYRYGEGWLTELLEYLEGNLGCVRDFIEEKLPKIRLVEPEGTYLLWLDVSAYGYSKEELSRRLREDARLWLDEGAMFGPEGEPFVRVNIASPRRVITEAMERFLRL